MNADLIRRYKERILQEADFERIQKLSQWDMRRLITGMIEQFMQEDKLIVSRNEREHVITNILDDAVGLGPLEALLQDDSVTEIMVNGPSEVYIEREGRLLQTDKTFRDETHLRHVIDRIAARVGRRIDESSPTVDARLLDGNRVHAVLPPISLIGPVLTIRKFRKTPFSISELLQSGTVSPEMAAFLEAAVKSRLNLLVSGGTGSGKTTLLNVLSAFIPDSERIITIEDSAELRLQGKHVVSMETRPPNIEGRGQITIRELVRNALRMRPDRIVVGEVRGGEALDMLQAMNTGHEGSLTTIHANSPYDAVGRLETMVLTGGVHLPLSVIRTYILSAVDLVIQTSRLPDGTRRVVSIAEIEMAGNGIAVNEIFTWHRHAEPDADSVNGCFSKSVHPPRCLAQMQVSGAMPLQMWEVPACC